MTGIAGYFSLAPKVGLVKGVHHDNHSACCLFERCVVLILVPVRDSFRNMAISAVQTCGGGNEPHRAHEFVYWNASEDLDILKHIFRHYRLRSCGGRTTG